jgi:hypothetical protein
VNISAARRGGCGTSRWRTAAHGRRATAEGQSTDTTVSASDRRGKVSLPSEAPLRGRAVPHERQSAVRCTPQRGTQRNEDMWRTAPWYTEAVQRGAGTHGVAGTHSSELGTVVQLRVTMQREQPAGEEAEQRMEGTVRTRNCGR